MEKILLVGDIGSGANGWYHVGDESMFHYNYDSLIKVGKTVYATSRTLDHVYVPHGYEISRIDFRDGRSGKLQLLYTIAFWPFMSKTSILGHILGVIKKVDTLIISGGGNLNSIRAGHLYFRFFLCYLAHLQGKDIYFSGQTLGPIEGWFDRMLVIYMMKRCKKVALRDQHHSKKLIPKAYQNKIMHVYDDAFLGYSQGGVKNSKNYLVGFSLHEAHHSTKDSLDFIVKQIISQLPSDFTSISLPHVFNNHDEGDLLFMRAMLPHHNRELNYGALSQRHKEDGLNFEEIIEQESSKTNLIVTTRYHGAVFALKHGVIPLMIYRNQYEKVKFEGLLDMLNLPFHYLIINALESESRLQDIIKNIFSKLPHIQQTLVDKQNNTPPLFIPILIAHDKTTL